MRGRFGLGWGDGRGDGKLELLAAHPSDKLTTGKQNVIQLM